MRKTSQVIAAALFFQLLTPGVSAEAAPNLRITSVSVSGINATLKWTAPKLVAKDSFIVEFTKSGDSPRSIKTVSSGIVAKLDTFSTYKVRIRKNSTPKKWTSFRTFTVTAPPITGVTVTNQTHSSVDLVWSPIVGATSYEVTVDKQPPVLTVNPQLVIRALKPGYLGKFSLRAVSGILKGEITQQIEFSTLDTGPIKLVASEITSKGFLLGWLPIDGASAYNIYKNKVLFGTTSANTLAVTGQLPGASALYTVRAVVTGVETQASLEADVMTLVDKPAKPVVSALSTVSAVISWTIDPNADSYQLKVYDATGTKIQQDLVVQKSIGSIVVSTLSPATTYTVGVINIYGKTASNLSELTTFITLKPSILGLTVSATTIITATIRWDALPSAATFEVFRDSVLIASAIAISTLSYTFVSLAPGQSYKFSVRATYQDGNKILVATEFSDILVTLPTDPSGKPTIVTNPIITLPYAIVPIIGATLAATSGVWTSIPALSSSTLQWQRTSDGTNFIDINGAVSSNYVVVVSDNGFAFRIKNSATNVNGASIAYSSVTGYTAPIYNVQLPITRGYLVVGQILDATDGTWSSSFSTNLSYRWQRVCSGTTTTISGALTPTYTITEDEIGCSVLVQVTGSTLLGSAAAVSPSRGNVTIVGNTVTPSISGPLRVGGTLAVTSGTWIGSPTLTYRWQSSSDGNTWDTISGATSSSLLLNSAQSGLYIRSQVLGSKTSAASVSYTVVATTQNTSAVPSLTISNSVAPVVTGAWTEGVTLSASNGTWSTSGTFTYQWQSSSDNSTWTDITSATLATFVLTASQASKYVRVKVYNTTSNGDGIAYSAPRNKVGSPYNTALPTVSGTVRVGSTQTVTNGTWSNTPTAFSYQWQKSSDGISWINVSGETTTTYIPTFDIANLQIRVSVSAGNAVDTATVTTAVISGFLPPQATEIPAITGTTTVGQTLTSSTGTWPGTVSGYAYQWQKSSDDGVTWSNIASAVASTYVLVAADAGYKIRSQVSLTTNTGSSSAYSLSTVGIAP